MGSSRILRRVAGASLALLFMLGSCASGVDALRGSFLPQNGVPELLRPSLSETESVNGSFPEAVFIKTRTQSFNSLHHYLVKDGRIWYKTADGKNGPKEWTLFGKTGLPNNPRRRGFSVPRKVVEISADADELVALSDEGIFYRICFDWILPRKTGVWMDYQGWPAERQLKLGGRVSANLGWALGKRNSRVRYYEDIFGNQHHNGTMEIATTYVLLTDGQEILYGDTGLPSDFSRNLLGPERGRFVAAAISASASTMFLIGEGGEMYTRLADFDTAGCDPMFFKYTYRPYVSPYPGTDYRSNYSPWALPSEDWRKQSSVPLRGEAAVSRRITILQNGMGNGARELRVAGLDAGGETGYWSKPIFGEAWSFVRAPLHLAPDDFLDTRGTAGRGPRGQSLDSHYRGSLLRDNVRVPGWVFDIPDFNILEGSCTLIVERGTERISLILHPVEIWTYLLRDSPGRDRTPKTFFVTLELPPGAADGVSSEFRRELGVLLSADRELFRFVMEAASDYLFIEPIGRRKPEGRIFLTRDGKPGPLPGAARLEAVTELSEFSQYHSPELVLSGGPAFGRERFTEVSAKAAANRALRAEIEERISRNKKTGNKATRSRVVYDAFNFLTHATLLYWIDFPKIYTLTRFGGAILGNADEQANFLAETRIRLDLKLLELLRIRIGVYESIADSLASGTETAEFPAFFAESFLGYWRLAGLPERAEGRFWGRGAGSDYLPARLLPDPLEREFPGWILEIGADNSFVFLVEVDRAADAVFSGRRPYRLKGNLRLVSTAASETDRTLYDAVLRPVLDGDAVDVDIRWDGAELSILQSRGKNQGLVFFSGPSPSAAEELAQY